MIYILSSYSWLCMPFLLKDVLVQNWHNYFVKIIQTCVSCIFMYICTHAHIHALYIQSGLKKIMTFFLLKKSDLFDLNRILFIYFIFFNLVYRHLYRCLYL